jgi:hypothetical protein
MNNPSPFQPIGTNPGPTFTQIDPSTLQPPDPGEPFRYQAPITGNRMSNEAVGQSGYTPFFPTNIGPDPAPIAPTTAPIPNHTPNPTNPTAPQAPTTDSIPPLSSTIPMINSGFLSPPTPNDACPGSGAEDLSDVPLESNDSAYHALPPEERHRIDKERKARYKSKMKQKQRARIEAYQEQQQHAQRAQQQYYRNQYMRQEQMRHLQDQRLNLILTSMAQSSATAAATSVNIANEMDKKNDKEGVFSWRNNDWPSSEDQPSTQIQNQHQ